MKREWRTVKKGRRMEKKISGGEEREEDDMEKEGKDMSERALERRRKEERGWKEMKQWRI